MPPARPLSGVMGRVKPNDLRRNAAKRMRELGISRGEVKMVLKHEETDVTSRYDRYDGLAEKRRALEIWGKRVEQVLAGDTALSNVVELVRA